MFDPGASSGNEPILNAETLDSSLEEESTAHYAVSKTYVYLILVNLPGDAFTAQEIQEQIENLELAIDWFLKVSPSGAQLDGKLDYSYTTATLSHGISSAPTCRGWIDEIATDWGYDDADDMAQQFKDGLLVNNFIMIFVPNIMGRSYACSYPNAVGERAVIFPEKDDGGLIFATGYPTYVHEMLHLFGACDEYGAKEFWGEPCNCLSGIAPYCISAINCDECDSTYTTLRSMYPNENCETCNEDSIVSVMRFTGAISEDPNAFDYYARGSVGWNDYDCDGTLDVFDHFHGTQCFPPIPDAFPGQYRNIIQNSDEIEIGDSFYFRAQVKNYAFESSKCWLSFSMSPGLEWDPSLTEVRHDDGSAIDFYNYPPGSAIQNKFGEPMTSQYELLDVEIVPFKYDTYLNLRIGFKALNVGEQWVKWRLTCPVNGVPDYYSNSPHKGDLQDQQGWEAFEETFTVKQKYCQDGTQYDSCSSTKPYYCDGENLVPDCQTCGCPPDSTCEADGTCNPIVQQCEPGSGPCCDGNGNYKPSTHSCAMIDTQYGCAGSGCGDDVIVRYEYRYCSGSSSGCSGQTEWSEWEPYEDCNMAEKCINGNPNCNYDVVCDVSPNGNFYVSDYQQAEIKKYSYGGAHLVDFESCYGNPQDTAWDGNYLWSVDTGQSTPYLCYHTADGSYQGSKPIIGGNLGNPAGLAWDGEYFWISNPMVNIICKVGSDGREISCFGTSPAFAIPRGLTWDGSYLWSTGYRSQTDSHKIYKLTKEGSIVASCSLPAGATVPQGLTFDGEDVWVTDWATDTVYRIDTVISSGTCSVIDQFSTIDRPSGLAYKPNTECVYGECCDNSGYYRSSSYKCQGDVDIEHGCPWGSGCGADAGMRYKDRYCPGNNFVCTGVEVWSDWEVSNDCTEDEVCSDGSCVYSAACACECTSGPCCDGCNIRPNGSQPDGFDDFYDCSGTNSPTGTSHVRHNNYYCNGVDTDEHLEQSEVDECGVCEYCEAGSPECSSYGTDTVCGSRECDGFDRDCRDYHDVDKFCGLSGMCEESSCDDYANAAEGTSCATGECDGTGFCLTILTGDVNNDCVVNIFDLAAVGLCFGQPATGGCEIADVNTDGTVNIFDLATVGLNYGNSC